MHAHPLSRWFLPIAQWGLLLLAAGGVFAFARAAQEGELRRRCTPLALLHPAYVTNTRQLPEALFTHARGYPVRTSSWHGKVVLLNFWTRTCPPCVEELPALAELTEMLASRTDVLVVTVSTEDEGVTPPVLDFLPRLLGKEPPFAVLLDPGGKVAKAQFGTQIYPETWLLDKQGRLYTRFDGMRPWTSGAMVELIDQLRANTRCPVEIDQGQRKGPAAHLFD